MLHALLYTHREDKIVAICGGLLATSLVLLAVALTDGYAVIATLFLDDYFFGYNLPLLPLFYILDIGILALTIRAAAGGPRSLMWVALAWCAFGLMENAWDISVFAYDIHLVIEELAFVCIYAYLLALLCAGRETRALS